MTSTEVDTMDAGSLRAAYKALMNDYQHLAAPDTGMVVVPRELLESAVTWLEVHSSSTGSAEWSVADDLRTILEGKL